MLLLSDIMFLFSQFSYTDPKCCKDVSVIWHWSLLSVHCWTVIVALGILVKMKSIRPAYKDLQVFSKYTLYYDWHPSRGYKFYCYI